jgi:hypothetical protein
MEIISLKDKDGNLLGLSPEEIRNTLSDIIDGLSHQASGL